MKTKIVSILSLFVFLCAFVAPTITAQAKNGVSGGPVDVKIKLVGASGFQSVKGTAKFRTRGTELEFQVEVENARVLAGAVLTVSVDGVAVGQITINNLGRGELDLNSRRGQTVPVVVAGSLVGVTTAVGDIVLAGQF